MAGLSRQELAELVPCSVENVVRLDELGLLSPGPDDGLYPPSDVHTVRLMAAFENAGVALEDVAKGVAAGDFTFPMDLFLADPAPRNETYEDLGERLGRSPELLRRLSRELGLPHASDDRVRTEDAEALTLIVTRLDLASDDELSRFARLYGGSLQRLVASGLQFFDLAVRQRIDEFPLSLRERDDLIYQKGAGYTELVRTIVPWLQTRHREHAVMDYMVGVTEELMETSGIVARPERHPPAIAFLDLTGYTELAEERGDEAAAEIAAYLADIVYRSSASYGGRPVKWLGDGVMFHFSDPASAVVSGLVLVEETERQVSMPARVGINAGAVVAQEGDYFGRTVNVASRIADYAQPHEVLVSEEARRHAQGAGVAFELIGDVPLKGVSRSVRLHRVTRAA
jgi:class 3 adenylate cyclase/DNA-binding transcriptional MerR regulator